MSCACDLLSRSYELAAVNLAKAQDVSCAHSKSLAALAPYPWTYPVYEATDRISRKHLLKKKNDTARTVREIWSNVLARAPRIDQLALRDTCKTMRDIYYVEEYRNLSLKKFVFNARHPEEILVLDWRSRREKDAVTPRPLGLPSGSYLPPRYRAVPCLRPAQLYEREKKILHQVFFETIVFEEFRQPSYIPDVEWTSRATFHSGVETPAGNVLLETSLASEPLYICPGHEHGSVMCERWTRLDNRGELLLNVLAGAGDFTLCDPLEWIEFIEAEVPGLEEQGTSSNSDENSSIATSENSSPSARTRSLPDDSVLIAEADEDIPSTTQNRKTTHATLQDHLNKANTQLSNLKKKVASADKLLLKGKGREGEKRKFQVATAPVDLIAGFSAQAVSEIVVGRFKPVKGEKWPPAGGFRLPKNFDRRWNQGITTSSKAFYRDGPLFFFMTERAAGWMPVNATDPIIFNNMSSVMHQFTLEHLEAVAKYLNLPPLPPPSKCRNPSVSTQDFLWRTFLGTNTPETDSLPATIKDAISGMVTESWRRTLYHEPVSKESPFCSRCATLICNAERHADLTPSLNLLKKESAKLRRATAALRFYKAASACPCTACKKAAENQLLNDSRFM